MSARMASIGVAVFVKTPALSPVKTRLAAGCSQSAALEFYRLSCRAVGEVLTRLSSDTRALFVPYWAVAEPQGARYWRGFEPFALLSQGSGALGDRLSYVYDQLFAKHDAAFLIGADCPQISARDFQVAAGELERGASFVTGPAADGGFYLFAGRIPIARAIWQSVPYSVDSTEAALSAELTALGQVARIQTRTDADTTADLLHVARELEAQLDLTPAQCKLGEWLKRR